MFNMIFPSCLFQILICISLPWNSLLVSQQINLIFFDGFNVVRCSDDQIQVYTIPDESDKVITSTVKCTDRDKVIANQYSAFRWGDLKLVCSNGDSNVHEEQIIERALSSKALPDVEGELASTSYPLSIVRDDDNEIDTIKSQDQPATDAFFKVIPNSNKRRIYLRFPEEPMTLCLISYTGVDDNPCPSMDGKKVDDVEHTCFYDPVNENPPTVEEMAAEIDQILHKRSDAVGDTFVLDLDRPIITPSDPSNPSVPSAPSASSNNTAVNPNQPSKSSGSHLLPGAPKRGNKKLSKIKIAGIIVLVFFVFGLIGAIGFFLFRKYQSEKSSSSSSSSTSIESGKKGKGSSRLDPNQSQQSLSTVSANDSKTEIVRDQPGTKGKPTVELQAAEKKRGARGGTSLSFNEDI